MIKDNQQHFNRLHVVLDGLVVIVSYALAWWLKLSGIFTNDHVGVLSFEFYMKALIFIVPLYLLLYYAFNLYTPKRAQGRRLELSNIIMANTVGILIVKRFVINCLNAKKKILLNVAMYMKIHEKTDFYRGLMAEVFRIRLMSHKICMTLLWTNY